MSLPKQTMKKYLEKIEKSIEIVLDEKTFDICQTRPQRNF